MTHRGAARDRGEVCYLRLACCGSECVGVTDSSKHNYRRYNKYHSAVAN